MRAGPPAPRRLAWAVAALASCRLAVPAAPTIPSDERQVSEALSPDGRDRAILTRRTVGCGFALYLSARGGAPTLDRRLEARCDAVPPQIAWRQYAPGSFEIRLLDEAGADLPAGGATGVAPR